MKSESVLEDPVESERLEIQEREIINQLPEKARIKDKGNVKGLEDD